MFDLNDFLDRAKRAAGVESDYALAVKVLGFKSPSRIANWRSGESVPNESAVLQLCGLTGDRPTVVAVELQAMRVGDEEAANLWRQVAKHLAGALAVLAVPSLMFVFLAQPSDAEASVSFDTSYTSYLIGFMVSMVLKVLWRSLALTAQQRPSAPA